MPQRALGGRNPIERQSLETDAAALARRLDAHRRFGASDLTEWVLSLLQPKPGSRVLELGCGTGAQTLPLAEAVGEAGKVTAIDLSKEALATLRDAAGGKLSPRIRLVQKDFDSLSGRPCALRFDRALACYSLYYARHPRAVLEAVEKALEPGGIALVCGPGRGNNAELRELHERALGRTLDRDRTVDFMETVCRADLGALFGEVELLRFENALEFDSVEALLTYWRSYQLFDAAIEEALVDAAEAHFGANGRFETVKRVLGLRAVAPGEA